MLLLNAPDPTEVMRIKLIIEALQSGNYNQRAGPVMRMGSSYNVGGVLCEIFELKRTSTNMELPVYRYEGKIAQTPEKLMELLPSVNIPELRWLGTICTFYRVGEELQKELTARLSV